MLNICFNVVSIHNCTPFSYFPPRNRRYCLSGGEKMDKLNRIERGYSVGKWDVPK